MGTEMKTIVVTGSSGLVATEFIHLMLKKGGYEILAVSSRPDVVSERFDDLRVSAMTLAGLRGWFADGMHADAVVHCAFARSSKGADVVSSLDYLHELLHMVSDARIPLFVNVSSQSVYGKSLPPFWRETDPLDPDYLYAMGKYIAERMVEGVLSKSQTVFTSIRLASVCENARFLNVFARNALDGQAITVQGGKQRCSFIDVRDAASGLLAIVSSDFDVDLAPVYNLGRGDNRSILELAYVVVSVAKERYGRTVEIKAVPSGDDFEIGMDCSLFRTRFSWEPTYSYEDMVASLFELNGGGVLIPWSFKLLYRT